MKVVVAVIVYDRFHNIQEWVRCWNLSQVEDCELVIIHNYRNEAERHAYHTFCQRTNIRYVPRVNKGFDIGAFQDVCRGRLELFPTDYEYLLWCTDDILPMRPTFIWEFVRAMSAGVSAACYEVSKEVKPHIRTTGFMVRREHLEHIQFLVDPVITKIQCYEFEHRDKNNTLIDQMSKLGRVVQVCDVEESPLWDTGHNSREALKRKRRREQEHRKAFTAGARHISTAKVVFICPIYNTYPEIIASLINQTHKNWELILVHDGPCEIFDMFKIVEAAQDNRIKYKELPTRSGNFGHHIRQMELQNLKDGDFVVITNGDNNHVPVFIEWMLKGFTDEKVAATYCSQMVHSYKAWGIIDCALQQGYLDCAGVMVRRSVAQQIGWRDIKSHSSDWLYFQDIANQYGWTRFNKVEGCLLVHN